MRLTYARHWHLLIASVALASAQTLVPGSIPAFAQSPTATTTPPVTPPPADLAAPTFLTDQSASDVGLAKAIGGTVLNQSREDIGVVRDFIVDAAGTVRAAVISVGGFLGVGTKDVAVDYRSLRITRDTSGKVQIFLNADRAALRNAPEFRYVGPG